MNEANAGALQPRMARLFWGYRVSLAMYAIVKLGLADAIGDARKDPAELAAAVRADAPSVARLLRFLASVGLVEEGASGVYWLTPLGRLLRSDVPGSFATAVIYQTEIELPAWTRIVDVVRTGESGFHFAYGTEVFEHLGQGEDRSRLFDAFMSSLTRLQARSFLDAYTLVGAERVVDVGGGDGTLLVEALTRYPHLRGTLFDQPAVADRAKERLAAAGVADRCEVVGGDFFVSVPVRGDLYLLKWIIHDWDDARAETILRNCRVAISSRGRLVLLERVVPDGVARQSEDLLTAAAADMNMLLVTGGRERTRSEYEALLGRADFRLTKEAPIGSGMWALEATPR